METLHVDEIDLHYGAAQILYGVSLAAKPASVTCILGRNGVGKTSLFKAIAGHHPVSGGEIKLGESAMEKSPAYGRAAKGIAYVPQGRDIFPLLSVEENLATGLGLLPKDQQTISEEIYELFPVLKKMLGRRGGDLSGGQQQQLAIGRALVAKPRILLLDEPTEGIQPSVIKDIARTIIHLREHYGMAIVLAEQYLEFCRELADEVYIMDRGAIIHHGPAEDLDKKNVRKHLSV